MKETDIELTLNKMKNENNTIFQITPSYIKKLMESKLTVDFSIKSRKRPLTYYRMIYYRLCKDFTNYSLAEIGFELNHNNKFDHSTVLHGLKCFEQWKNQNWFIDYYELYKALALTIYKEKSSSKTEDKFRTIDDVKHYYKITFIKMVEKYRNIINKQSKQLYNLKNDELVNKISNLDYETLERLKPRLEAFLLMNNKKTKV